MIACKVTGPTVIYYGDEELGTASDVVVVVYSSTATLEVETARFIAQSGAIEAAWQEKQEQDEPNTEEVGALRTPKRQWARHRTRSIDAPKGAARRERARFCALGALARAGVR